MYSAVMSQYSNSHRKTAVSFVNEHSLMDHVQVSPRVPNFPNVKQSCPSTTMNCNCSRTNFIEESNLLPALPRAFAVTGTGEKHYIPLEDEVVQNMYDRNSTLMISEVANLPSTHKRSPSSNKAPAEENNNKQTKISRHARRNLAQKLRLTFTPRSNVDNIVSGHSKDPLNKAMNNTNAQTQTDDESMTTYISSLVSNSSVPQSPPYMPKRQKQFRQPSQQASNRVYSMTDPNIKYYSDLRGIASVATFITVSFWLISSFFEMELITDLLTNFVQLCRSWYSTEEIPKTKAELVIQYLLNLWS